EPAPAEARSNHVHRDDGKLESQHADAPHRGAANEHERWPDRGAASFGSHLEGLVHVDGGAQVAPRRRRRRAAGARRARAGRISRGTHSRREAAPARPAGAARQPGAARSDAAGARLLRSWQSVNARGGHAAGNGLCARRGARWRNGRLERRGVPGETGRRAITTRGGPVFQIGDVSGSAFERGRLHGELARGQVERSLANYAHLFAYFGIAWDEAQQRAGAYREAIARLDADLLEEIDGIAAGAGRKPAEILALNARTELLPPDYLGKKGVPSGECTAIAVRATASATGGTLLAQNWDWLGSQREALILLRVPEGDRPGYLTLTEAGMRAKIGMNTLGFGICLNILRSVKDGRQPGVPVHVLLRALLGCRTTDDAIALAGKFRSR